VTPIFMIMAVERNQMKFNEWRIEMGLTQLEAARVHGVTVYCVRKWEEAARAGRGVRVRRKERYREVLTLSREELRLELKEMNDGAR